MIKQNVSSCCYLKDGRVWYELRYRIGMSSWAQGENRLNQFLKILPSMFQDHSWLPLKKPTPRPNEQSKILFASTGKHRQRPSWLHRFAHELSRSTEEAATEAQGTKMLSFETDPGSPGRRMDQRKDVLWVVPVETELPPKVIGTTLSSDPSDTGMLSGPARFGHTTGHTWIFISASQRWLDIAVFGQT